MRLANACWLSNGRVKRSKVADAGRAATSLEDAAVQFDDLPQGEIPHQARRRYSSSFFRRTRLSGARELLVGRRQQIRDRSAGELFGC